MRAALKENAFGFAVLTCNYKIATSIRFCTAFHLAGVVVYFEVVWSGRICLLPLESMWLLSGLEREERTRDAPTTNSCCQLLRQAPRAGSPDQG